MKFHRPRPGTSPRRAPVTPAVLLAVLLAAMVVLLAAHGPEARAAASAPSTGGTLAALSQPGQPAGTTPVQPGQTRWSVHPSTATALDSRNAFSYTGVEPGAQISDYVAVTNESLHAQEFAVYASDAYTTKVGGYDLLPAGQRPTTVGAWIHLAKTSVNLKAGQRVIIPFTLTVPADQSPGDLSGGIVAQVTLKGSHGVQVDERVGARVYLRVAGALRPQLTVSGLLTSYHANANPVGGGSATMTYTIANTGNVRLGYGQQVTVSGWFGSTTLHPKGLAQLLPGNSIAVRAVVPDVWPAGPLTAKVTLTSTSVAGTTSPATPVTDQASSLFEFPWPQLVTLIVLALLALVAWWGLRWRRTRLVALLAAAEERGRQADSRSGAGMWDGSR